MAEELRRKIESLQFANIPGYFPTPPDIVAQMLDYAGDLDGLDVLEPSAGSGAILDAIRERFPGAKLTACERHSTLRDILKAKGYDLAADDFVWSAFPANFDRVIMNPPFENGQDMQHVCLAHSWLKPGGRLVSIMSPGPFFRSDSKSQAFRQWFDSLDGEKYELPAGAFKSSGTGVATVLVVINKPE
jgi:16S rRNA G966 N2-methylase RsmD